MFLVEGLDRGFDLRGIAKPRDMEQGIPFVDDGQVVCFYRMIPKGIQPYFVAGRIGRL